MTDTPSDEVLLHSVPVPAAIAEFEDPEERQGRLTRLRRHQMRTLGALVGGFLLFCLVAQQFHFIQIPGLMLGALLTVWLGVFVVVTRWVMTGSGSAAFGTVLLWCWGNAGALVLVFHSVPDLHPMLLGVCLFSTLLAVQHVPWQASVSVNAASVLAYGAIIYIQMPLLDEAGSLSWTLLVLAGLIVMLAVGSLFSNDMARLRGDLHERNQALRVALLRLQELAVRDELTSLYNRRYLMGALNQQKALADRGGDGFAVAYLDLDYFKQVNDALGHEQGDRTLKLFARILSEEVREADCVARFGGEEFVLVLVGAQAAQAKLVAERIRIRFEQSATREIDSSLRVTTSVGVTRFSPGEEIDATLGRADRALYAAKRDGRNRVVVELAEPEDSLGPAREPVGDAPT